MKELEKLIFSLIIARLDGEKVSDKNYRKHIEKLLNDCIGGFIVFGGKYKEIKDFLAYLQSKSSKPLIIASDIERGVGQQIKDGTLIPSQMGIAAGFDIEKDNTELEVLYSIVANEALDLGINLALIPVLDVNTEQKNPIIGTRAFSDDPKVVSQFGSFVVKIFKSFGLATCGKHFPGHGSTKVDSHLDLPIVLDDIYVHIKPFNNAIKTGVPSIMVGHLLIPQLDTKPATLSEKIIKKLLREDLDFNGLVLTDAMNMKAIKYYSYPHVLALKAGADIILHPEDPYEAVKEILEAYKKDMIDETQLLDTVRKIDNFRKNLKNKTFAPQILEDKNDYIHNTFKKTLTILKNEISNIKKKNIMPYLSGFYDKEIEKLFESYFNCVFDLKNFKSADSIPLIAIFTNIKAGGREFDLTVEEKNIINKIISNKDSILVFFGNPYVVEELLLDKAKTIVLMYDSNKLAVSAFLEAFDEGLKISGKLPIKSGKTLKRI